MCFGEYMAIMQSHVFASLLSSDARGCRALDAATTTTRQNPVRRTPSIPEEEEGLHKATLKLLALMLQRLDKSKSNMAPLLWQPSLPTLPPLHPRLRPNPLPRRLTGPNQLVDIPSRPSSGAPCLDWGTRNDTAVFQHRWRSPSFPTCLP